MSHIAAMHDRSAGRKTTRPYTLLMSGRLVGFYRSAAAALETARQINTNRIRSGGPEMKEHIKIVYEQIDEPTRNIHEED